MQNSLVRKGLVLGIILLFVGTSITPNIFVKIAKADINNDKLTLITRDSRDLMFLTHLEKFPQLSEFLKHLQKMKKEKSGRQILVRELGRVRCTIGDGSSAYADDWTADTMPAGDYNAYVEVNYLQPGPERRYFGSWYAKIRVSNIIFFDEKVDFDYSNETSLNDVILTETRNIPKGVYTLLIHAEVANQVYYWNDSNKKWIFNHIEHPSGDVDKTIAFPVDTRVTFTLHLKRSALSPYPSHIFGSLCPLLQNQRSHE